MAACELIALLSLGNCGGAWDPVQFFKYKYYSNLLNVISRQTRVGGRRR